MTVEVVTVLLILLAAVVLFATERLRIDLVALLILATLLLTGILEAEEAISGFSNTATITVGAMFVLSAGLSRTGALNAFTVALGRASRKSLWLGIAVMMLAVGLVSAFINNTAAVAIFLPVVLSTARLAGISPSKMLMPLSLAGIFGGTCTLIGTSTNILVSSISERNGFEPFGLFELAPFGIVLLLTGTVYVLAVGVPILPSRRGSGDLTQSFAIGEYLVEIIVQPDSASVGRPLKDSPLVRDLDLVVLELTRDQRHIPVPSGETTLRAGDSLLVRTDVEKIRNLQTRAGIVLKPRLKWRDQDIESEGALLVEAVVAPNSPLVGTTLREARFRDVFGANVLAMRQRGEMRYERLGTVVFQGGDVLLVEVRRDHVDTLKEHQAFILISEIDVPEVRRGKMVPVLAIIAGVVTVASLGLLPIVASALIGCVVMILTRCITLEEAYESVDWRIIFLLAGVLTLGLALGKTGAALLIATVMVDTVGVLGPVALVSAFYLLTTVLTNAMSNNAAAALLAPIAISTAGALDLDARPFLMAVTFAASTSFMTPVGYQTNALVHGPGQYRVMDWLKVGTPLTVLFWILASILIPFFWEF